MSGHNKWSQIKHKKAASDAKKAQSFSKLAKQITLAAKEGGSDPSANVALRMWMDKAKTINMPAANVDKAVKRGTGELAGAEIKPFLYEAYGPGGVALLIEGATDNTNRTNSEIKHLLSKLGAKWAESGSVSYLFERKGFIFIDKSRTKKSADDLELISIEAGASDTRWIEDDVLQVITEPDMLDMVQDGLKEANLTTEDASLGYLAKMEILVEDEKTKQQLDNIFEALEEHDDVNDVYSNAKL